MKRVLSIVLACTLLLTGCATEKADGASSTTVSEVQEMSIDTTSAVMSDEQPESMPVESTGTVFKPSMDVATLEQEIVRCKTLFSDLLTAEYDKLLVAESRREFSKYLPEGTEWRPSLHSIEDYLGDSASQLKNLMGYYTCTDYGAFGDRLGHLYSLARNCGLNIAARYLYVQTSEFTNVWDERIGDMTMCIPRLDMYEDLIFEEYHKQGVFEDYTLSAIGAEHPVEVQQLWSDIDVIIKDLERYYSNVVIDNWCKENGYTTEEVAEKFGDGYQKLKRAWAYATFFRYNFGDALLTCVVPLEKLSIGREEQEISPTYSPYYSPQSVIDAYKEKCFLVQDMALLQYWDIDKDVTADVTDYAGTEIVALTDYAEYALEALRKRGVNVSFYDGGMLCISIYDDSDVWLKDVEAYVKKQVRLQKTGTGLATDNTKGALCTDYAMLLDTIIGSRFYYLQYPHGYSREIGSNALGEQYNVYMENTTRDMLAYVLGLLEISEVLLEKDLNIDYSSYIYDTGCTPIYITFTCDRDGSLLPREQETNTGISDDDLALLFPTDEEETVSEDESVFEGIDLDALFGEEVE